MIPVIEVPPPKDFDERVRQKGLDAIAELVGEKPRRRRPGPKRAKVAERREAIPAAAFPPFWRDVLPDMLNAYRRLCAYSALYIECGTGSPSIDHVAPVSKAWDRVYEWSNYRLACTLVNSRKGSLTSVLDPFVIEDDWFALELISLQVKAGIAGTASIQSKVEKTIDELGLNRRDFCRQREEYVDSYLTGDIGHAYLVRRAPFIARELRRQGKLRAEDVWGSA